MSNELVFVALTGLQIVVCFIITKCIWLKRLCLARLAFEQITDPLLLSLVSVPDVDSWPYGRQRDAVCSRLLPGLFSVWLAGRVGPPPGLLGAALQQDAWFWRSQFSPEFVLWSCRIRTEQVVLGGDT